jgi:uncharacterized protein
MLEILAAAGTGDAERVRILLAEDPAVVRVVDPYDKTPLHLAAEHDHCDVARALLDAGADIEAETSWGMTPLQWAGVMGSAAVGRLLIDHGARIDPPACAGIGRLDLLADIEDADVSRAFHLACRNGHTEVARALLARGPDLDHRGYFGAPAIHWAAINGHAETVGFLLEHGADATLRDDEFDADALGWAREGGDENTIARLASS